MKYEGRGLIVVGKVAALFQGQGKTVKSVIRRICVMWRVLVLGLNSVKVVIRLERDVSLKN